MSKTKNIKISAKSPKQRLDVFLAEKLKTSRSQVQKAYKEKRISINGQPAKKVGETVKGGDTIKITPEKTVAASKIVIRQKKITIPKIKILKITPDYIVLEKPWGLLTHSLPDKDAPNVADIIAEKYPEIKKVGDNPKTRPGIVHRLDKESSGILVIARSQKMYKHLKKQWQKRTVNKEYEALVHGKILAETGIINFPLKRSKKLGLMTAVPATRRGIPNDEGREAITEFEILKKFINFTLVKIKIHTGRTHQIRAHFLAYNHPLAGDPLYYHKKQKLKATEKLDRLFLHATTLTFTDLSGKKQTFNSPLPAKLKNFLKIIK